MKQTAHIEDWRVMDNCLVGKVFNHPCQHYFSRDTQMTSPIMAINEVAGTAETQNTLYTLGKKYSG